MKNPVQLVVGQYTDRGRVRSRNEDALGGPPPGLDPRLLEQKGQLHVVADGMGGEAGGQEASQLAVRTLIAQYYQDPQPDVARSLWGAVQMANRAVYQEARRTPELARMGTTLTAAVVRGEDLLIAQVGDSRAYLVRNGEIRQLTHDHTWVAEAQRAGTLTPEEARNHPNRHILTRALGADPEVVADLWREKLQPGDRLVLCSDGLSNLVSEMEILQQVQRLEPAKAAEALVALANERGSPDNVTAVVLALVPQGATATVPIPSPASRAGQPGSAPQPSVQRRGRKIRKLILIGVVVVLLVIMLLGAAAATGMLSPVSLPLGSGQATPTIAGPTSGASGDAGAAQASTPQSKPLEMGTHGMGYIRHSTWNSIDDVAVNPCKCFSSLIPN